MPKRRYAETPETPYWPNDGRPRGGAPQLDRGDSYGPSRDQPRQSSLDRSYSSDWREFDRRALRDRIEKSLGLARVEPSARSFSPDRNLFTEQSKLPLGRGFGDDRSALPMGPLAQSKFPRDLPALPMGPLGRSIPPRDLPPRSYSRPLEGLSEPLRGLPRHPDSFEGRQSGATLGRMGGLKDTGGDAMELLISLKKDFQ